MAEKRKISDESIAEESSKEAKVDILQLSVAVNCEEVVELDVIFTKHSTVITKIIETAKQSNKIAVLPHKDIPADTWKFINNLVVNRGFEGNPPSEYSLSQLFYVLEEYQINLSKIFLPKQMELFRSELERCANTNMFNFQSAYSKNLHIYFNFISEIFCCSCIYVMKHMPRNCSVDTERIDDIIRTLLPCPIVLKKVFLNIISKLKRDYSGEIVMS